MQIAVLLYDQFTALDAIGPYEVLSRLPGVTLTFVAETAEPVLADMGLIVQPGAAYTDLDQVDLLVVPGGPGTYPLLTHTPLLDWIATVHETTLFTTSVCTGALLLGAAGLLKARPATTHWADLERLSDFDAIPTEQRVVQSDRVITAAGVSAGIDMALTLAGLLIAPEVAEAIQLGIEYDPQPPYDTGSVAKAPPMLVEAVRRAMTPGE